MNDPYRLEPHLWFALLCEGVATDNQGRLTFREVFNQVQLFEPPPESGVSANAHLNAFLVVGFTEGLGHFSANVCLRDVEDKVLWTRPDGPWTFDIGPGEGSAAVLIQQVEHWFRTPGRFHFAVQLEGLEKEWEIPFEIALHVGPAQARGPEAPDA